MSGTPSRSQLVIRASSGQISMSFSRSIASIQAITFYTTCTRGWVTGGRILDPLCMLTPLDIELMKIWHDHPLLGVKDYGSTALARGQSSRDHCVKIAHPSQRFVLESDIGTIFCHDPHLAS